MFLLVGLGNPGLEYTLNRHNVGFMCIDEICSSFNFTPEKAKHSGLLSEGQIDQHRVLCFKPMTYMNRSGIPVAEVMRFFKIPLENLFVFHDELEIPFGKIRIKKGGGHAGHNGLRDIDCHLGQNYWRIRVGIDRPAHKEDVAKYVLQNFSKAEQQELPTFLESLADEAHILFSKNPINYAPKVVSRFSK